MNEVFLDTETTGLSFRDGHKVVEIACIETKDLIPTKKIFHKLINPKRNVPDQAFRIHGFSEKFLSSHETFDQIAEDFLKFIKGKTIIIHNANFDLGFINNELSLIGLPALKNPVVDTVMLARETLNTRIANLDYLCRRFNVDLSDRSFHGALLDSQLLASVYLELRGGKQFSMKLDTVESTDKNTSMNNINKGKTKEIQATKDNIFIHKQMVKKIKNPIWKKFNY